MWHVPGAVDFIFRKTKWRLSPRRDGSEISRDYKLRNYAGTDLIGIPKELPEKRKMYIFWGFGRTGEAGEGSSAAGEDGYAVDAMSRDVLRCRASKEVASLTGLSGDATISCRITGD